MRCAKNYPRTAASNSPLPSRAVSGRLYRFRRFPLLNSIPSSSIPSSHAAISFFPVSANGYSNVPSSSRLYQIAHPSRSQ